MKKNPNDFSLIDKGLTVEGTISCKGKLIVKGSLRGKIDGDNVIIAEEGTVQAELKAKSVSIGGRFEGTVRDTGELIVLSTGICSGNIDCGILVLEEGGVLNADIVCSGKNSTK